MVVVRCATCTRGVQKITIRNNYKNDKMTQTNLLFDGVTLKNRLGQEITLRVKLIAMPSRDYLFVQAPKSAPSSLVAKNAENFAHQLINLFGLAPENVDFIEVRDQAGERELLRWRFEWVGLSAHAARSQVVSKASQREYLSSVLIQGLALPVADENLLGKPVLHKERCADFA